MKTILTLPFILAAFTCFSQKNFLPGFIVMSNGDTVRGSIKYANWEKNPRNIEFIQEGKEPVHFGLPDLNAFEITGEDRYEKNIVSKSGRPTEIARLNEPLPKAEIIDTVFLRVLVAGKVKLYELVDKRNYYFLGDESGQLSELQYWLEPQAQSGDFFTRNTFRDQLRLLLNGMTYDRKINERINNLQYRERDLSNTVNEINKLKGSTVSTWKPVKKNTTHFFAGTGINVGKMHAAGGPADFSPLKYGNSVSPSFRIGADIASSRNLQRVIFRAELEYQSFSFNGRGIIDNGSVFEKSVDYDVQLRMISPTAHILYIVSKKPMDIYVGFGGSWNLMSSKNKHVSNYKNGQVTVVDPFLDFEKNWLSINGKLGMMMNQKWDVNINYSFGGSFVSYVLLNAGVDIIGVEINYRFQRSGTKKK